MPKWIYSPGIIPGAVPPANVLIDSQDSVKLRDVGVARISSGKSESADAAKFVAKFCAGYRVTADRDDASDGIWTRAE